MSAPTARSESVTLPESGTDAELHLDVDHDREDPWAGIPTELLDGTHSYDHDSAGGCG